MDKFWPVVKPVSDIKTEIKEEPIEDILDDTLDESEWDKAAEEEILAANEGYFDSPPEPSEKPKRKRSKPKSFRMDFETDDPDDPGPDR